MITDPPPRAATRLREFAASDGQATMRVPPAAPLQQAADLLRLALAEDNQGAVKQACDIVLMLLADFYRVARPGLKVLGSRPHKVVEGQYSWELFGDYTPDTQVIRVWMRTAVLGKVTSYRGLLNTLLHEFCHHLDITALGYHHTPHTRGFFGRVDDLYHLALATPPDKRKPLAWIKSGKVFRINWNKVRAK